MSHDSSTFTETVPPWNGQKEDKVVFSLALFIIVLAALLLWMRQPTETKKAPVLPAELRQVVTELSIAVEEIQMLQSLEGVHPSLSNLTDMGIAPFNGSASYTDHPMVWSEIESGCLIATNASSTLLLRLKATGSQSAPTYQIHWRAAETRSDSDQPVSDCLSTVNWQAFPTSAEPETNHHSAPSGAHSH